MRTMEILEEAEPALIQSIYQRTPPLEEWEYFTYCSRLLKGKVFGRVNQFERGVKDYKRNEILKLLQSRSSWHLPKHFSQNKLEDILFREVQRRGIEIKKGTELSQIQERDASVVASYKQGNQLKYEEGDLLVGADGAKSMTRKLIGEELVGSSDIQDFVSIHFRSKQLTELLRSQQKIDTMLYFIYSTEIVAVLVCHNFYEGEYVLQVPVLSQIEKFNQFDSSRCSKLIYQAVFGSIQSQRLQDLQILTKSKWQMTNQIASKLTSKKGRVILAGDSAHLFAPAGGFGLNSGFQDAHCLAHKLRGLDLTTQNMDKVSREYQKERAQIANQNRHFAHLNYLKTVRVAESLGLRISNAKTFARAVSWLPETVHSITRDVGLKIGRTVALNALGSEEQARILLSNPRNTLALVFPNHDTGYKYTEDGENDIFLDSNYEQIDSIPIRVEKGCIMPHLWISDEKSGQSLSLRQWMMLFFKENLDLRQQRLKFQQNRGIKNGRKVVINEESLKLYEELALEGKEIQVRSDLHILEII